MNEQRTNPHVPVYYLSGNHDIGYSAFHSIHPEVIRRYEKEFGPRNFHFLAGKVDFVVVDAQILDAGAKESKERSSSWEFIKTLSSGKESNPKVLLTHIPLYRPDNTACGPHHSSPIINQVLVLSGHDHDQCTVVHSTPFGPVTEHTLGTISWQQGNLYPSFMLLSAGANLSTNSTDLSHFDESFFSCLNKPIFISGTSASLWLPSLLLIFWPANGLSSLPYANTLVSFMRSVGAELFSSRTKEKDDEEDGEYEMVWDAEGSMHLVKKAVARPPSSNPDSRTTGRGSVVARPTARKHQQEPDSSVHVEMGPEAASDVGGRLPRPSKLKVRKVLQRLFRVIQSVIVIAVLNVSLYMMLLFKDWIDR